MEQSFAVNIYKWSLSIYGEKSLEQSPTCSLATCSLAVIEGVLGLPWVSVIKTESSKTILCTRIYLCVQVTRRAAGRKMTCETCILGHRGGWALQHKMRECNCIKSSLLCHYSYSFFPIFGMLISTEGTVTCRWCCVGPWDRAKAMESWQAG